MPTDLWSFFILLTGQAEASMAVDNPTATAAAAAAAAAADLILPVEDIGEAISYQKNAASPDDKAKKRSDLSG